MRSLSFLSIIVCGLLLCSHGDVIAAKISSSRSKKSRPTPSELNTDVKPDKITNRSFGAKRNTPVLKDAFSVGFVLVAFPDTRMPPLEKIKSNIFNFGAMSVTDYFKEYSQNVTWPELMIVGEKDFPKCVYQAPQPKGYYCEFEFWSNPLGYPNIEEGHARASELREAAEKYAFSFYKKSAVAAGFPLQANGRPHIVCYAFATKVCPPAEYRDLIRPHYKGRMKSYDPKSEAWDLYSPGIGWSDPLWPNSIPQVHVEGGGGTVCHEFGHVLGAPDFYHAPEKFDGVSGEPSLTWAYGPTGPGYCRFIYNAFLAETNFPTLTASGKYTLYPRKTKPAGDKVLGYFVPSAHPHYTYYLEYVKDEKAPLGNPGNQGLLIQVINVTLGSPLLGPPDMCYIYRPNDPWFRSAGDSKNVLWGKASGRKSFSMATEPSSRLPNLMDGGVTIDDIQESSESVTFNLTLNTAPLTGMAYKNSLIPAISLDEIKEILPTSFYASSTVMFRGEPMKTDYGFCWNIAPHPTIKNPYFPLYHRDRYGARILGLKPNTKYYVRAYARNEQGVGYSKEELAIKTPPLTYTTNSIPPLMEDGFSGNWVIDRFHGTANDSAGDFIGSAAITTLLKLTAYYRTSLEAGTSKNKSTIDFTRIHMHPSLGRPPARMQQFNETMGMCSGLANAAKMRSNNFEKDFDKNLEKIFGMRMARTSKVQPIEPLETASLPTLEPFIIESLLSAKPVVVAQKSIQLSPRGHGLSWVIIDGVNDKKEYHLVYPRGSDRDFGRKTGWYTLDTLLFKAEEARIIFGINPLEM